MVLRKYRLLRRGNVFEETPPAPFFAVVLYGSKTIPSGGYTEKDPGNSLAVFLLSV